MYKVNVIKSFVLTFPDFQTTQKEIIDASAVVRARIKLPFIPYIGIKLTHIGVIKSVEFNIDNEEFEIHVEEEEVFAHQLELIEEEGYTGYVELFTKIVCEGWNNAYVTVKSGETKREYWVLDEKN